MKIFFERKLVILILAAAGLVGLAYLAAGLRNLQFQPAEPLVLNLQPVPKGTSGLQALDSPLWVYLLFMFVLLVIFSAVLLSLDPKMRKRVGWGVFRFLITMAALTWVMENYSKKNEAPVSEEVAPAGAAGILSGGSGGGPVYSPPVISPWLSFGLSFAVAVIVVLLVWLLYRRLKKQQTTTSLGEIAGIARRAIDELADGGNWDEAIVECYVRMNQVATSRRGLIRQIGTTPSEFATRMERAGLPAEAVRALTRLFEQVRYGKTTPSSDDRNLAVAALNAILRACGETP